MGLRLERSLKDKDKTYSPQWKQIVWGQVMHKMAPTVWTFDAPLKKKQSVSFLLMSFSSTFLQNWSIIYVASFFPPSLRCEVQSSMDTTVGGAFPHRTRIFKRGICCIVAPSPNHPRPSTSVSCSCFEMFLLYVTWKLKLKNSSSLC